MDSMRSLNVSLPNSPPKRALSQPPEELLQSFRAAALSVTNLYKTAASDQARARRSGYQDALDDLLVFLDKQNLGLDDGEGWRVRQWATERLDGSPPLQGGSDSDDERTETEKRARSSSPGIPRKASPEIAAAPNISERTTSPVRPTTARPAPHLFPAPQPAGISERPETFTFQSNHPYPQDVDMQTIDLTASDTPQPESLPQVPSSSSTPAVRLEVLPRPSRSSLRNSAHPNKHVTRSTRPLGTGAGSKRRVTFGDFFDIGSLGDGKDSAGGGGKRARHG